MRALEIHTPCLAIPVPVSGRENYSEHPEDIETIPAFAGITICRISGVIQGSQSCHPNFNALIFRHELDL